MTAWRAWAAGFLALSLAAAPSGATAAGVAKWTLDPSDPSQTLRFVAQYERTPAPGVFRRFAVSFAFDPARPAASGRLLVTVDVTSADMDSADINEAIRAAEWFDVARFPRAEFEGHTVRRDGTASDRYLVRGRLRLKGVEREIEFPFRWREQDGGTAIMEGALVLDRRDFGIGSGEWARDETIAYAVRIEFKIKLRKASP
jgi:polyisoprenoid-binding protein YceI